MTWPAPSSSRRRRDAGVGDARDTAVIVITVADAGVTVEATLEVAEQGRLGYRYRLLGDGVALHGVVSNRHAALEAAFTRLLDHVRGRGVDLFPVVTAAVD